MNSQRAKTTEELLTGIYGSVVVKLTDICEKYDGTKSGQARNRANRNLLPFPAFRLNPSSHRSPWMVMVRDLAAYIDARGEEAHAAWDKSQ